MKFRKCSAPGFELSELQLFSWDQSCKGNDRESRPRLGSDATFFWASCSNLEIDDNFRISHNLGLAANISTALAIQPDRDREIEII
jgi:hypothetical protein